MAVAPELKILKLLFMAATISFSFASSMEDMENRSTKKHKSKFIKSLKVAIHAGDPGGGVSSFLFAITPHPLHLRNC